MSKYTPGPWELIYGQKIHGNGYSIAHINANNTSEGKANARLMVAAPELLEALENIMKSHAMSFYVNQPSEERPAWVVEALAVIAKAKGE